MKKRSFLGLFAPLTLLLCLALFTVSCAPAPPDYFAFRQASFCAEVRGTHFGKHFCAKLTILPQSDGYDATIEYLPPSETQGITLSVRYAKNGEAEGEVTVTMGKLSNTCEPSAVEGLLMPLSVLLRDCNPASVTHKDGIYTLTFEEGTHLTLGKSGIPQAVHTETVDFWVVWWENVEKIGK